MTINYPVRRSNFDLFNDFDNVLRGVFMPMDGQTRGNLVPAIDLHETENGYELNAELPGIDKDTLHVSFKDDVLTIEAGSDEEETTRDDNERLIHSERRIGKYLRTLRFGKNVDAEAIAANYRDGVLNLKLPFAERETAKKIAITHN